MEQAYAQALWEMIQRGKTPHEAVKLLKQNLEAKGRAALFSKVARAFDKIAAREYRKNTMELTVARKGDMHKAHEAAKKALAAEGIKDVELKEKIDESLVGGWRLEGRGVLLDTSWKKSLLTIYNRATQ